MTKAFTKLPALESASVAGEAGAKGVTHNGLPVDLRIVPEESFGNLLQHFTGSGRHNEALRTAAVRKGLHVSEYGVKDDETGVTHSFADEGEVYSLLGLAYIEPELREDRGELERELPTLLTQDDLKGDLHCHTTASDGRNSILEMGQAALDRGYEYLAITDHSASHGFGNDVQPDELLRQVERISEANEELDGITLLAGTEVNVLTDGALDYADDVLEQLDWIVASLHTSFRMKEEEMTARMVAAMEHPLVDVIGHPTGRLIGRREPYALDTDRVVEVAARTGTFLEINANPNRRDLPDTLARGAAEAGVTLVVDSDAHGVDTLHKIWFGVATARRAWLTPRAGGEHALVARARPAAQARQLGLVVGLGRLHPAQAGRAHQPRGRQRRRAVEPVLDAVALLDRLDGPVLVAGREREQDRVAGRDARHLGQEEAHRSGGDGEHRQRPHAVEEHGAGLELGQRRGGPGGAEQPARPLADALAATRGSRR